MQADSDVAQKMVALGQVIGLGFGDESAFGKLPPGSAKARAASAPQKDLKVSQAARAFLDVGLKCVGGVGVALMALPEFQHFAAKKVSFVERCRKLRVSVFKKCLVAREKPCLEKGRGNRDVLGRGRKHFGFGAYGASHGQPQLPEVRHKARGGFFHGIVVAVHEHQHVDVGVGKHFRAPVAAHGNDGNRQIDQARLTGLFEHEAVDRGAVALEIVAHAALQKKVFADACPDDFNGVQGRGGRAVRAGRRDVGGSHGDLVEDGNEG